MSSMQWLASSFSSWVARYRAGMMTSVVDMISVFMNGSLCLHASMTSLGWVIWPVTALAACNGREAR